MLLSAMFALAQSSIIVKFTAEDQNGNYFQLDAVKVTSISQNWNQTLAYPDTILILNYIDGIGEQSFDEGILQNRPNPFHVTTEAILNLDEDGQATVQLFDMKGAVLAEYEANLTQGEHTIKVCLAEPQMALLRVNTAKQSYVAKLLNVGNGGENRIEISSTLKRENKATKAVGAGPFAPGDVLSYVGIKMQGSDMVMSNNTVTQAQYTDDVVTFVFNVETPIVPQLPVVVTSEVSDITYSTAVCGGEVLSDGGAEVVARGVCWSTTQNPTTSDSHTTDGVGLGEFVSDLSNLAAETQYHVRAFATNSVGTAYGDEKLFTTGVYVPEGAINGLFSVSDTTKVYFSRGNLQYQASTNTCRFAENQWNYVGRGNAGNVYENGIKCNNDSISSTYDGWIDLFVWGKGNNLTSITWSNTFTDWGVNPISNGGNVANIWRTLSGGEWYYLLFTRPTTSGGSTMAVVNGVKGLIILPDDWNTSYYTLNNSWSSFYSNEITLSDWENHLEAHGAVFLPAAGKNGSDSDNFGFYWTRNRYNSDYAIYLIFRNYSNSGDVMVTDGAGSGIRFSVRLVHNIE